MLLTRSYRGLGGSDSPGESGSVYAAFAAAMSHGGCSYSEFTPEVCTKAMDAWTRGQTSGQLKVNGASLGHPEFMFTLFGNYPSTTAPGSKQAAAMVADAAAALGIQATDWIAPTLEVPTLQTTAQIRQTVLDILPAATLAQVQKMGRPDPPPTPTPPTPSTTSSTPVVLAQPTVSSTGTWVKWAAFAIGGAGLVWWATREAD